MQFDHYRHSQTSYYEMKKTVGNDYDIKKSAKGDVSSYTTMFFQKSIEEQNKDKEEKFKERLEAFKKITTKAEARELASKIMPVKSERTVFRIGVAKCIIINKEKVFRITFISETDFICFSFQ